MQVWYSDGQHEVLDTSYILKLSTSTTWRKQLMALQGHVAPQSVEFGIYQANEDVNTKYDHHCRILHAVPVKTTSIIEVLAHHTNVACDNDAGFLEAFNPMAMSLFLHTKSMGYSLGRTYALFGDRKQF